MSDSPLDSTSPPRVHKITIDITGRGDMMEVHVHDQLTYGGGKQSFVFELDGDLVTKYLEPVRSLKSISISRVITTKRAPDLEAIAAAEAEFISNRRFRRLHALLSNETE